MTSAMCHNPSHSSVAWVVGFFQHLIRTFSESSFPEGCLLLLAHSSCGAARSAQRSMLARVRARGSARTAC
jgi:hypothetical protein